MRRRAADSLGRGPTGSDFELVGTAGSRDTRPMVSYGQYCPVARAAEILGDRWTLLIVREMVGGVSGFNQLGRCLPGISRSVLAQRMRALERAAWSSGGRAAAGGR